MTKDVKNCKLTLWLHPFLNFLAANLWWKAFPYAPSDSGIWNSRVPCFIMVLPHQCACKDDNTSKSQLARPAGWVGKRPDAAQPSDGQVTVLSCVSSTTLTQELGGPTCSPVCVLCGFQSTPTPPSGVWVCSFPPRPSLGFLCLLALSGRLFSLFSLFSQSHLLTSFPWSGKPEALYRG